MHIFQSNALAMSDVHGLSDTMKLPPFIIQSILILVAPALFAASIYMVLGHVIRLLHADDISIIKPKWLTKIFVAGMSSRSLCRQLELDSWPREP